MNADTLVRVAGSGWGNWLRERLAERGWAAADLIRRSGGEIDSSQTTRWLKDGSTPKIESVRAVCAALELPTVQGLLAAGLLEPEDVGVTVVERPQQLDKIHHRALLGELARRLDEVLGEAEPSGEQPESPARIYGFVAGEQAAARRRPPAN